MSKSSLLLCLLVIVSLLLFFSLHSLNNPTNQPTAGSDWVKVTYLNQAQTSAPSNLWQDPVNLGYYLPGKNLSYALGCSDLSEIRLLYFAPEANERYSVASFDSNKTIVVTGSFRVRYFEGFKLREEKSACRLTIKNSS